ncbi:MAG: glycoside hydrolase family 88 protein [Lachnospiraceae bacterium]|nr:glycoside hydrolase family 88 protein [Lachnospiraceae bacterium]
MDNKVKEPLFYAKASCETMMRKFDAPDLPPVERFHYHAGVFLSGVYQTYELCKDERYFDYMKKWVDTYVDENGAVSCYQKGQLDDIQPGILLFPLLERTGDERYKKALDELLPVVKNFPRNEVGGFWHKEWYPNQMWLDGLYMGGPICTLYAKAFDKPEYMEIPIEQAKLMCEHTKDPVTGLWFHAWDATREAVWADKETGLAPEFWGRSIGWVPVALLNELDSIPETNPGYNEIVKMTKELIEAICKFQSEDGRWYQVVNKGGVEGNWLENSCSCLYTAAICKAVRKGILDAKYLEQAKKGYEGVIRSLEWEGEDLLIGNICVGTGVGNYQYYCDRPTSTNDLHGVGAFLIMCTEVHKALY